ncbi:glutamine amidotransferase family protein [Rhodococcus sp. TAF43]|uniref:class II glutamine amidotransferase n=1 Tax=unclassified Rhodococcus (in: high G+C Gram-positive bacteria) TaxID=192944 RepID=UPI0015837C64|nr:glutamine amidotransferase family protein [Rhodococcus sp. W8901]QKT13119.1 glutamine amidotransferase family protein [Rhodococcus sp. W8901]
MCGIVGLHLREPSLYPKLGELLTGMLGQMVDRGPDSAGMAIYGDPTWSPPGHATVTLLDAGVTAEALAAAVGSALGTTVVGIGAGPNAVLHAPVPASALADAALGEAPGAILIGFGDAVAVLKGMGDPVDLAHRFGLPQASGWQGVAHTRMATESAVTAAGSHPFAVGSDQCLVHNGSFSNHLSVKRELEAEGVAFDSENDTEVGARFVAKQLAEGVDLEKALRLLGERFDGFYTLLVSTEDSFAVVRDPIACKPAIIAEHDRYVAMASEYRALAGLPGIADARIFEPEPEEVYVWHR